MRRRRAIVCDDDPAILELVASFFEERGYDVIALAEPVPCGADGGGPRCDGRHLCADVIVTDLQMPGASGIELLESQERAGCPIPAMNKAVLSGGLDHDALAAVRRLGCAWFRKPFSFTQIGAWVRECEFRTDLAQPLRLPRRERRVPCHPNPLVVVGVGGEECVAEIVNRSSTGICLRLDRPLEVGEALAMRARPPAPPARLTVRWSRLHPTGGFLAGASCC